MMDYIDFPWLGLAIGAYAALWWWIGVSGERKHAERLAKIVQKAHELEIEAAFLDGRLDQRLGRPNRYERHGVVTSVEKVATEGGK